MADRKAKSVYYHLEARIRYNSWSSGERATFCALLQLCAELNPLGAFRLHKSDVQHAVSDFDFAARLPSLKSISLALQGLFDRGHVIELANQWVFVRDYWGTGRSVENPNHRLQAQNLMAALPKDVCKAIVDAYGDAILDGVANQTRDPQKQKQKQKQNIPNDKNAGYLQPAALFCKMIEEAKTHHGWSTPTSKNNTEAAADMLRLLVEQDQFPATDIPKLLKAFHWALYTHQGSNGFRWGKVLLGVAQWRKDGKLLKMYDAWNEPEPSSLNGLAEIVVEQDKECVS